VERCKKYFHIEIEKNVRVQNWFWFIKAPFQQGPPNAEVSTSGPYKQEMRKKKRGNFFLNLLILERCEKEYEYKKTANIFLACIQLVLTKYLQTVQIVAMKLN
jgi:hypothetical protein